LNRKTWRVQNNRMCCIKKNITFINRKMLYGDGHLKTIATQAKSNSTVEKK